uniref:Uncharacterized protein n=1 Tax=Arundo donax TaxID=35708 RepID=A0A0A9FZZ4_ARUDO
MLPHAQARIDAILWHHGDAGNRLTTSRGVLALYP